MGLSLYAAYYFKRAAALRPHDSRMWTALAACYEALERRGDAIACYERAAVEAEASGEGGGGGGGGGGGSGAGEALLKLARLHAGYEGGAAAAQQYYARFCRTLGEAGAASADAAEAFLHLAKAAVGEGRLEAAETYALKVVGMAGGGAEEQEARALLAQLREDAAADLDEIGAGMDLSG